MELETYLDGDDSFKLIKGLSSVQSLSNENAKIIPEVLKKHLQLLNNINYYESFGSSLV